VALVQDNEVYHYHLDHLGTPRELTNNKGDIVWKVRYRTWGNVALKECEEIENNIRFQGQYFDEETGLHYNRHRYYNPDTGQFISQDPIGLLGGVNNYQYAPNPLGWIDPFGLTCKEDLINSLSMSTPQAQRIASAIQNGDIGVNLVNYSMFSKMYKHYGGNDPNGVQAFAIGNNIYLRQGSQSMSSDTVHEGTHALDEIAGFNGTPEQWEKRAYFYERQYQVWNNDAPEFNTIKSMMLHIDTYY